MQIQYLVLIHFRYLGEPINPEAWKWYNEHVGRGKCSVVDTYWQTETGAHVAVNLPGIHHFLSLLFSLIF
jgi:acyl-coenzyme A synthetase/AMP-(fatty) acid ligase